MNYYINFLNLIKSISNNDIDKLDVETRVFLDEIATRHHNCIDFTVGEAISLSQLGSTATLHRRISNLLNLNLISLEYKGTNRRTKYIKLTLRSVQYYEDLAKLLKDVYVERPDFKISVNS